MPPTIVARPITVKRLFRLCSCAHATVDRSPAGIHRSIGNPGFARIDLSRLRGLLTTNTRARRGGSPSVDDGG
jgi:hypothetical protein